MSDDPLYREIILEHWQHPQNYGTIEDADINVSGNNPVCGDQVHITAKLKDGTISDIAFTGEGCAISKASASLFTEFIRHKSLQEIGTMSQEEALSQLGIDITPARIKCALLPYATIRRQTQVAEF